MPTLRELNAQFLQYGERIETYEIRNEDGRDGIETGVRVYFHPVETLAEAHGVEFLCPKCFMENNGIVGTHAVICWFVGRVPDHADPSPGRWTPSGTGIDDLTFVPGDPPRAVSVLLTEPSCGWHGFVNNGVAS